MTQSYTYDNAGNTLSGEGATYTYSPFNRLATATKAGITTTYAINALGQRVHKKVGSGADHWFTYGPGGQQLGEYNGGWTHYVRLPDGTPIARVKGGDLHMIHTDHLGRPEIVTNSAKAIVWRASNYAFDRTVTLDSIGGLNLGFPGQYYDQETGNWYNVHRTYNPRRGRYLESDPIGLAGGLNTYAYVGGNPVNSIDPFGLKDYSICETRAVLDKAEKAATEGNIFHRVNQVLANHSGLAVGGPAIGRLDTKVNASPGGDTYTYGGRTMNEAQFGNYLAGYAGYHLAGVYGLAGAMWGGVFYDMQDNQSFFRFDLDSRDDIVDGGKMARSEIMGEAPPCGCK